MKIHSIIRVVLGLIAISSIATASRVGASIINFSDQPAGPDQFPNPASPQTLVYHIDGVTVTFSGGLLLTNEAGTPDPIAQGNVYATGNPTGSSLVTPLTITFSEAVKNLAVTVANGLAGDYLLSDNAGHSDSFSLPTTSTSEATGTLANAGTVVDVGFTFPAVPALSLSSDVATTGVFDFALTQVSFDVPAPPAVPEPSAVMLGGGLFALAVAHFRQRFNR